MAEPIRPPLPREHMLAVNSMLRRDIFAALDDQARDVLRRLAQDLYAHGHHEGRISGAEDTWTDVGIEGQKTQAELTAQAHTDQRNAWDAGWWAYAAERQAQEADPTHVFTKTNPHDRHDDRGARGSEGADQ